MRKKPPLEAKHQFDGWPVGYRLIALFILPLFLCATAFGVEKMELKGKVAVCFIQKDVTVGSKIDIQVLKALVPPPIHLAWRQEYTDSYQAPCVRKGSYRFLDGRDYGIPFIQRC